MSRNGMKRLDEKNDLIRRGEAEHRVYTKCAGKGDYTLAQSLKDTIRAIPAVVSAKATTRKVWIAWNADMTQGIVMTDPEQAKDLVGGYFTEGDMTEAFVATYGGDTVTLDAVELEVKV